MDVDLDTSARNRPKIIQRLKEEFGEDNILNICTFKTESSKSALKTVCRGLGITNEKGGYLSSLVPVERGKQWSLSDCLYGNEEDERKPIVELVNEIKKLSEEYEVDFAEYALLIEGLVSGLSLHASGIYIFKDGYIKQNSLMKTPRGDSVTCWSMEDSDYTGGLKYDSLTTECMDKLEVCIELLLKYHKIDWQGSIRDTYNRYIHPSSLNYDDQDMWEECCNGQIIDLFQFITPVGGQCIRKVKPHNIVELTNANSLMRITVEGDKQPVDKFLEYKQNRQLWYDELKQYGVTNEDETKALEDVLDYCYGVPSMQEDVMEIVQRPEVSNFTLADADGARKIIAKKKKNQVAGLREKFYKAVADNHNSENVANYVWNEVIKPQLAYSFSRNHVMPYSAEALQEMNLYHFYSPTYWNCSALTVNAGMADEEETKNIAYDKLAKAIYRSINFGVGIKPPDINKSEMGFTPLEETNEIFFGLGAIASINKAIANQIISNRPYNSFHSFYTKNTYDGSLITPSKFLMLIKSGCFDIFNPDRTRIMKEYIYYSTPQKKQLTMANFNEAVRIKCKFPKALLSPVNFKKYVTSKQFYYGQHPNFKSKKLYCLDGRALKYFNQNCKDSMQEGADYWVDDDRMIIVDKSVEKLLKKPMDALKEYINTDDFLKEFNKKSMAARYDELCPNKDANMWSFESCSFFSQQNVFAPVDLDRYNITPFEELPEEPVFVDREFRGRSWKQYELSRIIIIVLSKNDNTHTVTGLDAHNNVVNIKFNSSEFAWYRQQISEQLDGSKVVRDKSWFGRGVCLIVTGYRSDNDSFKCKNYRSSIFPHKLQKIEYIDTETGELELMSNRYGYGDDEE